MQHTNIQKPDRIVRIYRVTYFGIVVNTVLVLAKFATGILGHSAAMLADAVHSLSDFLSDIVVLIFVRISGKPQDARHNYGYGKYETLSTLFIAIALLVAGVLIFVGGTNHIVAALHGETLSVPGMVALWAALASIILKELTYHITVRVGRKVHSDTVIANAWNHRSDALSSIGTALGIGGAILLGEKWTVLDPIVALIVSVILIVKGFKLALQAISELMEHSLPKTEQDEIAKIVAQESDLTLLHNLRTRRVGNAYAIELHLLMPGQLTLCELHQHSALLERRLKQHFGEQTHVVIQIDPINDSDDCCTSNA